MIILKSKEEQAKYYLNLAFNGISIDYLRCIAAFGLLYNAIPSIKEGREKYNSTIGFNPKGTMWLIKEKDFKIEIFTENVEEMYKIGVLLGYFYSEHKNKKYFLHLGFAGRNAYKLHWIPLFTKILGWIKD